MKDYKRITPEEAWELIQDVTGPRVYAVILEEINTPHFKAAADIYDLDLRFHDEEEITRLLCAAESEPIMIFKEVDDSDKV